MSDGGYDYEIVGDTFDDFFCQICLKLMKDAVQLECGHGMCDGCLQGIVNSAKNGHIELACPKCRRKIIIEKIVPAAMLNQVILCVKVKCENLNLGCMWIGNIGDIRDHLLKICDYRSVECQHCKEQMLQLNIDEHKKKCVYRVVMCRHCEYCDQLKLMKEHLNTCELFPLPCPNNCTDEFILRIKMIDHIQICSHEVIQCDFVSSGCDTKVKRMDMQDHMNESMQQHLLLVMKENIKTKSTLQQLQEFLLSSMEQNTALRLSNENLEKHFSKDLAFYKNDLVCTKHIISGLDKQLLETKKELKELQLCDKRRSEYSYWVENKLIGRVSNTFQDLLNTFIEVCSKVKLEIKEMVANFDKNCCLFESKLDNLTQEIHSKVDKATTEMDTLREPYLDLNMQQFLDNNIQEMKNTVPLHEEIWKTFQSNERLQKIKSSLTAKYDAQQYKLEQIFVTVNSLTSEVTYENRIKSFLKLSKENLVYEGENILCSVVKVDDFMIQKDNIIIFKVNKKLLTHPFGIVLNLHNQQHSEVIRIGKHENGRYCLHASLPKLVQIGFVVDDVVIISVSSVPGVKNIVDKFQKACTDINTYKQKLTNDLNSILTELNMNQLICSLVNFSESLQEDIKQFDQNCMLLQDGIKQFQDMFMAKVEAFNTNMQNDLDQIFLFDPYMHYTRCMQLIETTETILEEFAVIMESSDTRDEICSIILQKYKIELCKIKDCSKEIQLMVSQINYSDRFAAMISLINNYKLCWGTNDLHVISKMDGTYTMKILAAVDENDELFVDRAGSMFHDYSGAITISLRNKNSIEDEAKLLLNGNGRFSSIHTISSLTELGYITDKILVLKITATDFFGSILENGSEWMKNHIHEVVKSVEQTEFDKILAEKIKSVKMEITNKIDEFDANCSLIHTGLSSLRKFIQVRIDTFPQAVEKCIKGVDVKDVLRNIRETESVTQEMLSLLTKKFESADKEGGRFVYPAEKENRRKQIAAKCKILESELSNVNYSDRFFHMLGNREKKLVLNSGFACLRYKLMTKNGIEHYQDGLYVERKNDKLFISGMSSIIKKFRKEILAYLCNHKQENLFQTAQCIDGQYIFDIKKIKEKDFILNDVIIVNFIPLDICKTKCRSTNEINSTVVQRKGNENTQSNKTAVKIKECIPSGVKNSVPQRQSNENMQSSKTTAIKTKESNSLRIKTSADIDNVRTKLKAESGRIKKEITVIVDEFDENMKILGGYVRFEKAVLTKIKAGLEFITNSRKSINKCENSNLRQNVSCAQLSADARIKNVKAMKSLTKYQTRFKVLLNKRLKYFDKFYKNEDCSMVALKCVAQIGSQVNDCVSLVISRNEIKLFVHEKKVGKKVSSAEIFNHLNNGSIKAFKELDCFVFQNSLKDLKENSFIVHGVFVVKLT